MVYSRLLEIDTEKVSQGIEAYIVRLTESHGAEAVVMGLSGGVDSAVLASLVVRALGPERVLAYYLYDRDNEEESAEKAQLLAEYLGLPGRIRNQIPSPDMAKGITDEHAMGISYKDLDIILHWLENEYSEEQIVGAGVTRRQILHVRRMHELSAWKRTA